MKSPHIASSNAPDNVRISELTGRPRSNSDTEERLKARIAHLELVIEALTRRSDETIMLQVDMAVEEINSVREHLLIEHLNGRYTEEFFRKEPDRRFKIKLAQSVYQATMNRSTKAYNYHIESIVNNTAHGDYLLGCYFDEE